MVIRKMSAKAQEKKRVAAYCRVSTNMEEQEGSFELQVSYYEQLISSNQNWELAGIYADRGKSGTSTEHRPGFQRMLDDALKNHTIDLILVKSISRFSRNLVDCDRIIKELKTAGVEVRFEKENISSFDPTAGFVFSLLAAVAQDESRSISENVRWSYANRFKRGEYNIGNNQILGYDCVDGKLVPNDKAPAVRRIFELFTQGKTIPEIAETLENEEIYGMRSNRKMSTGAIAVILRNETYAGDKLLQKKPPKNYLTKRPDPSIAYTSYYLKDDHEAIIDRATWEETQKLLDKKHEELEQGIYKRPGQHPLYGKLFCGKCGTIYRRRTLRECPERGYGQYKAWNCREREFGRKGNGCKNRIIRETHLMDELSNIMSMTVTEDNIAAVLEGIERINVFDDRIEVKKLK